MCDILGYHRGTTYKQPDPLLPSVSRGVADQTGRVHDFRMMGVCGANHQLIVREADVTILHTPEDKGVVLCECEDLPAITLGVEKEKDFAAHRVS